MSEKAVLTKAPRQAPAAPRQDKKAQRRSSRSEAPRPAQDSTGGGPLVTAPPLVRSAVQSQGQPLEAATRDLMEPHFNYDFSQVQIHTDPTAADSARAVHARAYTIGRNIVFGKGRYTPQTAAGQKLLAHELAHVVQQEGAQPSGDAPMDDSHERAAEAAAAAITTSGSHSVADRLPGPRLARAPQNYEEIKTDILTELNRKMPAAILEMIDGLDSKTREALNADPQISGAITALPPKARDIVIRHLTRGSKTEKTKEAAASPMTRGRFEAVMKDRYGVKIIRNGTFQDQAFGDMKESDWKPWNVEASSPVYALIVEAFASLEKTFGGLPPVNEIVFYDAEYHRDDQGKPVKDTDTGASYYRGHLDIYTAVQTGNKMFNLNDVMEKPTLEQSVKRNITHELGHGIAETALNQGTDEPPGADPDLFKEYLPAIGWTKDGKLYDVQEKAVQDAFTKGTVPPEAFHILPDNVDTKMWKERPLTKYMATSSSEDFAEAIMAYVNEPERLKKFSPARYDFIDKHKSRWLASAHKMNIWEETKQGGPTRVLKPSRPPNIWEKTKEAVQ